MSVGYLAAGFIVGAVVMAYATSPTPSRDTELVKIDPPIVEKKSVRVDIGKGESLVVRSTGTSVVIEIWYQGVNRGKLADVDITTKTVLMPVRPPVYWSIGER